MLETLKVQSDSLFLKISIGKLTNRTLSGNYTVEILVQLNDYPETKDYLPKATLTTDFRVVVIDPCQSTTIIPPNLTMVYAFPGYPTLSSSNHSATDTVTLFSGI